jgi:DNA-binding CsgD family transcriptional regulator
MPYAAAMSSPEAAIALFTEPDIGQLRDRSVVLFSNTRWCPAHSLSNTWAVRRTIVRARSALISMRIGDASRATAQLKCLLSNRPGTHFSRFVCALRILEAFVLAAEDDLLAARSLLTSVVLHDGDTAAASVLRYVDWRRGEREEIYTPDLMDYLAAPVGGKVVFRILSLCVSAALAFDRLLITVSANLATEALQLARLRYGNHSPMSIFPAILLAQVAYEQGRFEEAETLLRPRLSVIRASGMRECVARASVLLSRLSLHRGRHRAALAILRETEALGHARRWPRLVSVVSSEYARTLEVLRYDERQGSEDSRRANAPVVLFDKTRGASNLPKPIRTGEHSRMPARAFRLQQGVAQDTMSPDDAPTFIAVETDLRRTCSSASHVPLNDSYELLIPWLRVGAARGLRMVFVDAGRPLLTLLKGLYYALPTDDPRLSDLRPYIATLLKSTIHSNTEESPSSISYRPLSCRETGVLQMIAHGMSNKRIAQSLGITPETVKSHAKSIFVKLATRTRAQAVARAEAIGFL